MKNIRVIELNSEIGAGTRGASLGPAAVKIAALDFGSSYFKKYRTVSVPDENRLLFETTRHDYAKRIDGILAVYERLSKEIERSLREKNSFPIVLAGDHSSAGGTIAGIKMAYPGKRLGVIWIDAHADLHTPFTTPSGNVHGMPLAVCLGEDNLEQKINDPEEETVQLWDKLKNIGSIMPKIRYEDIVMIAVRDTEKQEDALIKKHGIRNFTVAEFRRKSADRVATEALYYLKSCDIIYVSFDVDSMDSSISKGTGTPVPNGITEKEAGTLVASLLKSKKICCFEMVEVNPTLDRENLMAENAFEILQKATNQLIKIL